MTTAAGDGSGNVLVVATIVARNYAAFARVLTESVRVGHPQVDRVTLLVDGTEADRETPGVGRVVLPADLGLAAEELEPMAVMYTVMELSTALKPALLRFLLREGYEAAAYLDPDILVTGSLDEVFDAAREHAIALTPHVLTPVPLDGLEIAERTVMQAGVFNLGFIAVGQRAMAFLDWWHLRLTTQAVVDFAAGLFTDQKWIDWVPALFEHTVLRDPGLNVAYWNAHERPLTLDAGGAVLAAGSPLVFLHFSGFDPTRPWILSRFTGRKPRALVSDSPVLARLCQEYASLLDASGHAQTRATPYGFDRLGDRLQLTPAMRTVYRESLLGGVPFAAPPLEPLRYPDALAEWFETPARLTPWFSLTPAEYARWLGSPELRAAAPQPLSHSLAELRGMIDGQGAVTAGADLAPGGTPSGWTVFAGGSSEPSGESLAAARRVAEAIADAGFGVDLLQIGSRGDDGSVRWESAGVDPPAACANVIVCLDAGRFVEPELAKQLEGCPGVRVGLWLTSDLSEVVRHPHFLHAFDEVWVLSDRLVEVVRASSPARVARVRLPGAPESYPSPPRARTGLTVLAPLDARAPISTEAVERTVGAYLDGVLEGQGHRLVLEARDGRFAPGDAELIRHVAAGREDVLALAVGDVSPAVDVVLALDPRAGAGVLELDELSRGASVVTGSPGAAALEGIVDGVVRLAGDSPDRASVTAALRELCAGFAGSTPAARSVEVGGRDVVALLDAAAATGRRPGRGELRHRGRLEQEIALLRAEVARCHEGMVALEATTAVRASRAVRAGYQRSVGEVGARLRRVVRW